MRRSRKAALPRDRRGVAAVEFALLLPFLLFALLATVDYCRVFYCSLTVSNCARNGALYGSADQVHAQDTSGIATATRLDASNLNLAQMQVSSSTDNSVTYLDVRVTYPFTTFAQYPGIPRQTTLSRTVRMSVVPATPTFH